MSRTYRLLNTSISEINIGNPFYIYKYLFQQKRLITKEYVLSGHSKIVKKELALCYSDKMRGVMRLKGPSWFHNLSSQRPHRRKAKREIYKFMKSFDFNKYNLDDVNDCFLGEDYHHVIIESKPHREYWY